MPSRTEHTVFRGRAGTIDCLLDWPEDEPRGWALVLHPHPLHGGTRDNKVVTTIARACTQQGLVTVRPNFRGVDQSEGEFDNAVGETADMQELISQFEERYPQAVTGKWALAGFSFGTAVAAQLYDSVQQKPRALILAGTAVQRFQFRDIDLPPDSLLIHGEVDEVVELTEAMDFARKHALPMVVIPDASHFFHGKLIALRDMVNLRLAAALL